jgi:hypothetical protein
MTNQSSDLPEVELKSLDFRPIQGNGPVTVYQALVVGDKASGSPVFALTASIASSDFHEMEKEFLGFLSQTRAAFAILPEPESGEGEPDDDEPFDIRTQIAIEPKLITIDREGIVGVAVTVQIAIGNDLAVTAEADAVRDFKAGPHNKDQYWYAHKLKRATCTPTGGSGTIRAPKGKAIPVSLGYPGSLKAKEVIVHSDKGLNYNFSAGFDGPFP